MWSHRMEVAQLTLEHLVLVGLSILIAAGIGLPLGVLMTRKPGLSGPILTFANAVQTIPSLALFGFLIPLPFIGGIGARTAIVALVLYSLLPIIRNTFTGISGVDPAIREAGRGMGMTDLQLLWSVEIPLALSVIFAGLRVATVLCVGVATIAAAVGAGGLGMFIFRGVSMVDSRLILAGAIPAAALALIADFGLGAIEKRFSKLLCLLVIAAGLSSCSHSDRVVVGSKNFTEQVIMGEMLAQQIERKTHLPVDRKLNLGGTIVCHEALTAGQIDTYVEYTGTGLTAILKEPPAKDSNLAYQTVKDAYKSRFGIEWTEPLGFNNTFAIIVRKSDAEQFGLRTISDAAPRTSRWVAGFGYEFIEREDGYPGLVKTYNLRFPSEPRVMDLGLTYKAVAGHQVDLIAGNSTDGLIGALGLVVLEDDKHYFPPYDAVPLVREAVITKHPEIREALRALGGKVSEEQMRLMNYAVDGEHKDVKQVVKEFLDKL
ncbi:MAG: glycine/betaine ABC transporter substrate-binding protein [Acidobacteria bacterium 13_1_20CM_2_55_15]|nr:MAG: glycine/betaine ABC transporter substrate-binding protein [Acidobacteria bacterium 13_1_40CM_56_16]OLD20053.1 MAG: glycine/betaine ABC transporter substrate-binding protein [Acidobacteria bacterium 13_1_40CM_3_56_11]OLD69101.1 MAG: glycine/betaine ABC transporter substrate-binding protein [Acidobacteria bacterium 13_1_40CM_2_56_11]OLE88146.1 MAG: glycine/betaine ABC transporter substrate-binding protein [Acidobacteria bacterium 13_1_20CM_2_55_15]PYR86617.1 MAG: glycine/betaine ABC trans